MNFLRTHFSNNISDLSLHSFSEPSSSILIDLLGASFHYFSNNKFTLCILAALTFRCVVSFLFPTASNVAEAVVIANYSKWRPFLISGK